MRINLTKKDLINSLYMQIGFSKKISENLLDDILITHYLIILKKIKNLKFQNLEHLLNYKKKRVDKVETQLQKKIKLYLKEMLFYLNPLKNLRIW